MSQRMLRGMAAGLGALVSLGSMAGCGTDGQVQKVTSIKIGVTVYDQYDTFVSQMMTDFNEYAAEQEEQTGIAINVEVYNAAGSQSTQNSQVEEMLDAGCNVICVNLVDRTEPTTIIDMAEKNNVPVLMLTAKSDEEDKVSGLRLGADDYLTKPFSINELMARVNSLIRRYTTLNPVTGNEAATMLLKDMVIDKVNRTVTVQNIPVELTGKEFDLLLVLASNKGRVFTKKQLYTQVWTEEYDFDDNNIMAFISKLRKKIEPNPEQPFYIQTVRGVGYRFNKEA